MKCKTFRNIEIDVEDGDEETDSRSIPLCVQMNKRQTEEDIKYLEVSLR